MSLKHCGVYLYWPGWLLLARHEAWIVPQTLCLLRWCVGVYSTFKDSCVINFFGDLLF